MKIWDQVRLHLVLYDFERIILSICLKLALHTSWVERSVCFFYYRSMTLVCAGVNQRQWVIMKQRKPAFTPLVC